MGDLSTRGWCEIAELGKEKGGDVGAAVAFARSCWLWYFWSGLRSVRYMHRNWRFKIYWYVSFAMAYIANCSQIACEFSMSFSVDVSKQRSSVR